MLCEIRGFYTVFKFKVFLDFSVCRLVNIYRGFGGASCLCVHGIQINGGLDSCYYVQAFFEQGGEMYSPIRCKVLVGWLLVSHEGLFSTELPSELGSSLM